MAYEYEDCARADILQLVPPDGKVIGSVGCGFGATEAELVKQGREVHGVDIAAEVESRARGRLTSFSLIRPGDPLPWEKGSLDGLILADVLEHIPAAWDVLKAWSTLVRPGGWVAISVPNMRNWDVVKQLMLKGDWPENGAGIFDRTHLQVMTHKRLFRWCDAAGLDVEKVYDQYDPNGPRRNKFFRRLDKVTLRLFHTWLMYQIKCTCRRRGATP